MTRNLAPDDEEVREAAPVGDALLQAVRGEGGRRNRAHAAPNETGSQSEITMHPIPPADRPRIETARLMLRVPRPQDAGVLTAMMTPAVSRGLGAWPVPFTPVMAHERINGAHRAEADGLGLARIIERMGDATVLGWIGVSRADPLSHRATLGYWLGEAHHGHGYMREAASAMIALAFATWEVDAIEASTHSDNPASAAVLRGCGLLPMGERTLFAPARHRDELCIIFELRRPGT